ncbi:pro-neuregulin-3, membrane-bound isoform [Aplochiton taeniatus]
MNDRSGASSLGAMSLEEPGGEPASPRAPGPLRCGPCAVWPRQQTWLCAVPLVMGFVGLGLSLMLLKWIVVGSVQDYVPTDLVDTNHMGQDPIFLSKPSGMPKGVEPPSSSTTPAASTIAMVSTTTPLAADGTAPAARTRFAAPANHSASGGGNRAPHLHNRIGTRVGATEGATTTTTAATARAKEVTPRSTVRKGPSNGRSGGARPGQTTTASTTTSTLVTSPPHTTATQAPTSTPSAPAKPTQRWNHGRSAKGSVTRPHHRFRTMAPTSPSLRSEVFKPCVDDKDLAFCLNEGECSIIETVAGVHRHCRCKERYHGLRCDQFVPKTDAILSDPTDELGIEFMESRETYQRQVLSIFSIASGICILGVACIALYRRNKRHREKLRAHFSESRHLRDCSIHTPGLASKCSPRPQYNVQLQKSFPLHGASSSKRAAGLSGIPTTMAAAPALNRAVAKGKRFRSSSLSLSPARQRRDTNHFRTPPIPRSRNHLVGGARVAGHTYKHLHEVESTEMEAESFRGWLDIVRYRGDAQHTCTSMNMQSGLACLAAGKGWTEVPCTRLDGGHVPAGTFLRAHSVAIIPSLQGCDPEGCLLEMASQGGAVVSAAQASPAPCGPSQAVPVAGTRPGQGSPSCSPPSHAPPGSGTGTGPRPAAAPLEAEGGVPHESLVGPAPVSGPRAEMPPGGTNTVMAVTVLDSKGEATRYTPRLVYKCPGSRGPKAGGQREAQGPCQHSMPEVTGGTHWGLPFTGTGSRATGHAPAKPFAS